MDQTTIPSGLLSHILLTQAVRQKQVVAGHRERSAKKIMNRLKIFILLLITAVVCYGGSNQSQLIGGWMNVWPGKGTAVIEFKTDGTFSAEIHFEDGKTYSNGGTWKLKKEKIIYEYRNWNVWK